MKKKRKEKKSGEGINDEVIRAEKAFGYNIRDLWMFKVSPLELGVLASYQFLDNFQM